MVCQPLVFVIGQALCSMCVVGQGSCCNCSIAIIAHEGLVASYVGAIVFPLTILIYGDVVKPGLAAPDHVMVRIHAASINPLDFRMRSGLTRIVLNYALPMILGHDCSGTVIQVGDRVTKFKVGDEG